MPPARHHQYEPAATAVARSARTTDRPLRPARKHANGFTLPGSIDCGQRARKVDGAFDAHAWRRPEKQLEDGFAPRPARNRRRGRCDCAWTPAVDGRQLPVERTA